MPENPSEIAVAQCDDISDVESLENDECMWKSAMPSLRNLLLYLFYT